jgi:hypothetical protein
MSGKKIISLPRLLYHKDTKTSDGYAKQACHSDFQKKELEGFSNVKNEFEWPKIFSGQSMYKYPSCYGIYCIENNRFLVIKFRDDGFDEINRPHTVAYEVALCDLNEHNEQETARFLASFLNPSIWREADVAFFEFDSAADDKVVKKVGDWIKNNPRHLFLHVPEYPAQSSQQSNVKPSSVKEKSVAYAPKSRNIYKPLLVFSVIICLFLSSVILYLSRELNDLNSIMGQTLQLQSENKILETENARLREENEKMIIRLRDDENMFEQIKKILQM